MGRGVQRACRGLWLSAVLVMWLMAGCSVGGPSYAPIQITGIIEGEHFDAHTHQGTIVPMAATITCNATSTTSNASGAYQFTVPGAASYHCTATSAPYAPQSFDLPTTTATKYQLNFDGSGTGGCAQSSEATAFSCPILRLAVAKLQGQVVATSNGGPQAAIGVQCRNVALSASDPLLATTDDAGMFTFGGMAPGTYFCLPEVSASVVPQQVTIQSGLTAHISLQVCDVQCPKFYYHGGQVMHTSTTYLIFWQPPGTHFSPLSDGNYQALIKRYLSDVGDSTLYHLLTQYWDSTGFIQNMAAFGGSVVDTHPFEHCLAIGQHCTPTAATRADPLTRSDLEIAVQRAMMQQGWTNGADKLFLLYLPGGAQVCVAAAECSFLVHNYVECAYHATTLGQQGIIAYGVIFNPQTAADLCQRESASGRPAPNGDWTTDVAISLTSHEQFEAITDSQGGWYFDNPIPGKPGINEIADGCEERYGQINADGSNVHLNGHPYLVQQEWSNQAGACALA